MLDVNDFVKKQILVYAPLHGDKLCYQNDNLVIKDSNGKVKYQHTCYAIFLVIVVGDTTITTGLLRRAKKFGFSICFVTQGFKLYARLGAGAGGNTLLHKKQYTYESTELARMLICNKIRNQRQALMKIRKKTEYVREGIRMLDECMERLQETNLARGTIVGIEGTASRVYFARVFYQLPWKGRKPRTKCDYINTLLDIGYNLLFNFIDCILQVFGFDEYYGVLHTCFYMRKSLVCDLMEPFRVIIDWRVRIGFNLGQIDPNDFVQYGSQWQLEYKQSAKYVSMFMKDILDAKEEIFLFVRGYYRAFMKGKEAIAFPQYDFEQSEVLCDCSEL